MMFRRAAQQCVTAIILFAFLILGCSRSTNAKSLLTGTDDCSPPCWLGVYPGETTIDDAVNKLQVLELQGEGKLYLLEGNIARWNASNNTATYMYVDESGLVSKIRMDTRGSSIRLSEVLAILGDPSDLDVGKVRDGGYFSVNIFYPVKGLTLVFSGQNFESKNSITLYEIEPDMILMFSYFLPPSDVEAMVASLYDENVIFEVLLEVQAWKGYGTYNE